MTAVLIVGGVLLGAFIIAVVAVGTRRRPRPHRRTGAAGSGRARARPRAGARPGPAAALAPCAALSRPPGRRAAAALEAEGPLVPLPGPPRRGSRPAPGGCRRPGPMRPPRPAPT